MGRSTEPDHETWVGDEEDGCYVRLYKNPRTSRWRVVVVVDSDTAHFTDSIFEEDNFVTKTGAEAAGLSAAANWCLCNNVAFDISSDE